jgi:hypothetical protein
MDFVALENERMAWSLEVFPEATPISSLHKAREEIKEIYEDITHATRAPEEYADAIMCLFDSAGRQGISATEIVEAYGKKLEINKGRTWIKNADNTYSHVKN